jgi:hypothetical protein
VSNELHPVLTLPRDPIAVAEITAALIRADARQGHAMRLGDDVRYELDSEIGGNRLRSPEETSRLRVGQCFDLTRAEGAYRGTHVGCVRTPIGFHVFLAFFQGAEPIVYDVSRLRGMDGEPDYAGAAYAPIWPPGRGPVGHDRIPDGMRAQAPRRLSAAELIYGAPVKSQGGQIAGVVPPIRAPSILPKAPCPGSCAIPRLRR